MEISFRLLDFNIKNETFYQRQNSRRQDNKKFIIQMFGMNEEGKTFSVFVSDFTPFFYVKLPDNEKWGEREKNRFRNQIIMKIGECLNLKKFYEEKKVLKGEEKNDGVE